MRRERNKQWKKLARCHTLCKLERPEGAKKYIYDYRSKAGGDRLALYVGRDTRVYGLPCLGALRGARDTTSQIQFRESGEASGRSLMLQ